MCFIETDKNTIAAAEVFTSEPKVTGKWRFLLRQTFLHEPDMSWSERIDWNRLYKENADNNQLTDFKRQYYDSWVQNKVRYGALVGVLVRDSDGLEYDLFNALDSF